MKKDGVKIVGKEEKEKSKDELLGGKKIIALSKKLVNQLMPFCYKLSIAGSIRRKSLTPRDIDIVLIPKHREELEKFLKQHLKAKFVQGGEHESTWKREGIKIELYYTTKDSFGATLLAYSSKKGSGIGLRMVAKRKGFRLNNYGLFKIEGKGKNKIKRMAGKTEREIYKALNRPYKQPWNR